MTRTSLILSFAVLMVGRHAPAADDWTPLLKGDTLDAWQSAGGAEVFKLDQGTLTVDGVGQIVYMPGGKPLELRHFELRAEVLTKPGGRAGISFDFTSKDMRASSGFEVRIDNSYGPPVPGRNLLKTGSLVWLRPVVKSVVPDDRWFRLQVFVRGRRIQVHVENQLVVDYVEPQNWTAFPRLRPGTIAVRGHDGSGACVRHAG